MDHERRQGSHDDTPQEALIDDSDGAVDDGQAGSLRTRPAAEDTQGSAAQHGNLDDTTERQPRHSQGGSSHDPVSPMSVAPVGIHLPLKQDDPGPKETKFLRYQHEVSQYLHKIERFLVDTWWPELLGLIFSACCLIVIAILLWEYGGGDLPHISGGLTLNVIISILAAGSKSSLMFSVAATMS